MPSASTSAQFMVQWQGKSHDCCIELNAVWHYIVLELKHFPELINHNCCMMKLYIKACYIYTMGKPQDNMTMQTEE